MKTIDGGGIHYVPRYQFRLERLHVWGPQHDDGNDARGTAQRGEDTPPGGITVRNDRTHGSGFTEWHRSKGGPVYDTCLLGTRQRFLRKLRPDGLPWHLRSVLIVIQY